MMSRLKNGEYNSEEQYHREECSAKMLIHYTDADLTALPKRKKQSHKGSYGKVLVIAGSSEIFGAAYFAAAGAYRTGSGLVKVYTPEENRIPMQMLLPEALLEIYDSKRPDFKRLQAALEWADTVVLGPGLGTKQTAEQTVQYVFTECGVPMVVDADAINLLAKHRELLQHPKAPIILTPHLLELSRLSGRSIRELQADPLEETKSFCRKYPVILVRKDAETIVCRDGEPLYVNTSGNPGMATGGSGDVLTGIIASLIGQGMEPLPAARLGVYLHGRAGDAAAEKVGMYSMLASDILSGISEVTRHEKI